MEIGSAVSLDILVKGDIEEMKEQIEGQVKEQINTEDIRRFNQDGAVYTILFIATMVTAVPLFLWSWIGVGIWVLLAVTMEKIAGKEKAILERLGN